MAITQLNAAEQLSGVVSLANLPASTSPASTNLAQWDANNNLSANNVNKALSSVATTGGNTTLTVASPGVQVFTGTSPQTVLLPSTGAPAGTQFQFVNQSSGAVTVQSSNGNTMAVLGGMSTIAPWFDAVGTGYRGFSGTLSETHTITGNAVLVYIVMWINASSPTVAVTVGGVSMTQLASVVVKTSGGYNEIAFMFGLLSPPTGTQTISATVTNYGASGIQIVMDSVSYGNVTAFGTAVTAGSASGNPTMTVSSSVGSLVAQSFFSFSQQFYSYNQINRLNYFLFLGGGGAGPWWDTLAGDAPGASSVTFSALSSGTTQAWGGAAVSMSGAPMSLPSSATLTSLINTPTTSAHWSCQNLAINITNGKTLSVGSTLNLLGTDSTTMVFPPISDTVVGAFSTQTLSSKTLSSPTITGYTETTQSLGTVSTAVNVPNLSNGTLVTATLTNASACVFTLPSPVQGLSFLLYVKQPATTGSGTYSFTSPSGRVIWPSAGTPSMTQGANASDLLSFACLDGTNWFGSYSQGYV